MSLAIKFSQCNVNCKNCYERIIREKNSLKYDIGKVAQTLRREIKNFPSCTIHGGEPLTINIRDLEYLFKIIYDEKGYTGIQTNLLLLNSDHIKLFKKYKTHVGVSLDGSDTESNQSRGYNPDKVLENLLLLKENDINRSLITVMWESNTKYDAGKLKDFLRNMSANYGINDIRLNPGIAFYGENQATDKSMIDAYIMAFDLAMETGINIQPIRDIIDLLFGSRNSTCNFSECDPYGRTAEIPIFEDGSIGSCLKNTGANDGLLMVAYKENVKARYEALSQIYMGEGGCRGCRYWPICKAGCPGEAVDNDWRNKSRFCEMWLRTFEYIENRLKNLFPNLVTLPDFPEPERATQPIIVQSLAGSVWAKQYKKNISDLLPKQEPPEPGKCQQLADPNHGDTPHGDSHGDHNDAKS